MTILVRATPVPAAAWRCVQDLCDHTALAAQLVERGYDRYRRDIWLQEAAKAMLIELGDIAARTCRAAPMLAKKHPELCLTKLVGVRHLVAHGHFIADAEELWLILTDDLPPIAEAAATLLKKTAIEGNGPILTGSFR